MKKGDGLRRLSNLVLIILLTAIAALSILIIWGTDL